MREDIQEIKTTFEHISKYIWRHKEYVNRLNVFPVPDGDTGLNMALTIQGGLADFSESLLETLTPGEFLKLISDNMLMNSRGCSGVILALFFQGFIEVLSNNDFSKENIYRALERGCKRAYEGTDNPKEGTILTLMTELKNEYSRLMKEKDHPIDIIVSCIPYLRKVLDKTPEMLPVLKQAGVVDSGGAGFIILLEGLEREFNLRRVPDMLPISTVLNINKTLKNFLERRRHSKFYSRTVKTLLQNFNTDNISNPKLNNLIHRFQIYLRTRTKNNQHQSRDFLIQEIKDIESSWNPEIKYKYCTELTLQAEKAITRDGIKEKIQGYGDSLIILEKDKTFKIHIHTNKPDAVIKDISSYGEIVFKKIDDMKKQHRNFISEDSIEYEREQSIFCIVSGSGFKEILEGLGADFVYDYGKKKPSVNKLVTLLNNLKSKNIIAAPDDGDILMALKYAASYCKANVFIVESKSAISLISLLMGRTIEMDAKDFSFTNQINRIRYCAVSRAVRTTTLDDVSINKKDYFVIYNGKVILSGKDQRKVVLDAIKKLLRDETLITFYKGLPVKNHTSLVKDIKQHFPHLEFEEYYGGQHQYHYYITFE
ncbi:MAG: DAK2 domain-containing protein [Candidatus Marinimicrobia bacterium]|nr:DAK2 domain-containing protein [Candidatus Neomarinimicrobiota bacterium]